MLSVALGACGSNPGEENEQSQALEVGATVEVAQPISSSRRLIVATDGDGPGDNGSLWLVDRRGRSASVSTLDPTRSPAKRSRAVRVPVKQGTLGADVARWEPGTGQAALFTFARQRGGLYVRISSLGRKPRVLGQALAPVPPPRRGAHEDYAISTWEGTRPDLFVIERGVRTERMRVRIYSGESGFSSILAETTLRFRGVDPKIWDVDVGRVTQPRPDLLLMARDKRRKRAEVHIASGEQNFQSFSYERELDLPAGLPRSYRYSYAVTRGTESFVGLDVRKPGKSKIQIVPLFKRAGEL